MPGFEGFKCSGCGRITPVSEFTHAMLCRSCYVKSVKDRRARGIYVPPADHVPPEDLKDTLASRGRAYLREGAREPARDEVTIADPGTGGQQLHTATVDWFEWSQPDQWTIVSGMNLDLLNCAEGERIIINVQSALMLAAVPREWQLGHDIAKVSFALSMHHGDLVNGTGDLFYVAMTDVSSLQMNTFSHWVEPAGAGHNTLHVLVRLEAPHPCTMRLGPGARVDAIQYRGGLVPVKDDDTAIMSQPSRVNLGSNGQVLSVRDGEVAWADPDADRE